ncbi:MAG: hypothetical protein ACXWFQ_03520 [Thermoanaerobaculia bacterium]
MKKQTLVVAGVCVVALALASSLAWAASSVFVDAPFPFMAKDTAMRPGGYEIRPDSDMTNLVIRSTGGSSGRTVTVPVIERLADSGAKESKVVFDKVEGKHYLSEVHISGMDGFLVGIAKGKETHHVLPGKEK